MTQLWLVYVLRCRDGSLYCGATNRLKRRLVAHQTGKGAKYTRSRLPVELVYTESCVSKSAALKREYVIKRMSKQQKETLVQRLAAPAV